MKQKTLMAVLAVALSCCCLLIVGAGLVLYFSGYSFGGGSKLDMLMINKNDLPSGWESADHYYSRPYQEGSSAARDDVFQYTNPKTNATLYLSHEVILYPSEGAAATGYQIVHDKEVANAVLPPKPVDFAFAPRSFVDKFDNFCTDGPSSESYFCVFVQLHGKYVIELRAVFDNDALTAAQVNEVLQRLDSKLP